MWAAWGAVWRDVIVLDVDNSVAAIYNLSPPHDLAIEANREELKDILRGVSNGG